jgi:hypothetical protein
MARQGRSGRRYAVFGIVILVHAVFVALALRPEKASNAQLQGASPLIFLNFTPPTRSQNLAPVARMPRSSIAPKRASGILAGPLARPDAQAAPSSDAWPLGLGVDWNQEAQRVAGSQAESIFMELKLLCDEAALRGEQPPGCHRYKKPDAWVPEPKKFGISGGLPYVRLGKRCVLGLGFFGCGVGKLPEPDGHALDDMRDPDRPRSSVPDPNE